MIFFQFLNTHKNKGKANENIKISLKNCKIYKKKQKKTFFFQSLLEIF